MKVKMKNIISVVLCILSISLQAQSTILDSKHAWLDVPIIQQELSNGRSTFQIPIDQNSFMPVTLLQNDAMDIDFQRAYPDIKTYDAINEYGKKIGNVTISPFGIWIAAWVNGKFMTVSPSRNGDIRDHTLEFNHSKNWKMICGLGERLDSKVESSLNGNLRNSTSGDLLEDFDWHWYALVNFMSKMETTISK